MRCRQISGNCAGDGNYGLTPAAGDRPAGKICGYCNDDEHDDHVHAWQPVALDHPASQHSEHQCRRGDEDRSSVERIALSESQPQPVQHMLGGRTLVAQAECIADLSDGEESSSRTHETQDHRFGDIAGEVSQLEDSDEDLSRSDHCAQ